MKIFVNGTFDIIHIGHLGLLSFAKSLGDYLLVALDSDDRVRLKKGSTRPINTLAERLEMMIHIKGVDETSSFSSDVELTQIIKDYSPDIMVVGSDWKGRPIIGGEHAKEIIYYERTVDVSSTSKIQRITAG